jgi:hypothetical protein
MTKEKVSILSDIRLQKLERAEELAEEVAKLSDRLSQVSDQLIRELYRGL